MNQKTADTLASYFFASALYPPLWLAAMFTLSYCGVPETPSNAAFKALLLLSKCLLPISQIVCYAILISVPTEKRDVARDKWRIGKVLFVLSLLYWPFLYLVIYVLPHPPHSE